MLFNSEKLCSVKIARVLFEQVSKSGMEILVRNTERTWMGSTWIVRIDIITSRDPNGKYIRTGVEQATIYTSISTSLEHTTRSHLTPLPNYDDRIG